MKVKNQGHIKVIYANQDTLPCEIASQTHIHTFRDTNRHTDKSKITASMAIANAQLT